MSDGVITVVYADDHVDYWPDTNWYLWQAEALLAKGDAVHIERDRDQR